MEAAAERLDLRRPVLPVAADPVQEEHQAGRTPPGPARAGASPRRRPSRCPSCPNASLRHTRTPSPAGSGQSPSAMPERPPSSYPDLFRVSMRPSGGSGGGRCPEQVRIGMTSHALRRGRIWLEVSRTTMLSGRPQTEKPPSLVSRYSAMPSWPPSRPRPLSLEPPKGRAAAVGLMSLMPTMPNFRPSNMRKPLAMSRV